MTEDEIRCPFYNNGAVYFYKFECPYLRGALCEDILTAPGNSDAWCICIIQQYLWDIGEL